MCWAPWSMPVTSGRRRVRASTRIRAIAPDGGRDTDAGARRRGAAGAGRGAGGRGARGLRGGASGFAQRGVAPSAIERDEAERYERRLFAAMGELGLTAAPFPT